MRELLRSTAGAGAAAGGPDQPTYQPPPIRPAFKSLKSPADNADPKKEV